MEVLFSIVIGVLVATGIYLIMQSRVFPVVLGLTLLSYAVNLFIFFMGRLKDQPALIGVDRFTMSDPIPQALVLTAIVIGFAMTAFITVLSLRNLSVLKTDHVDGEEPKK